MNIGKFAIYKFDLRVLSDSNTDCMNSSFKFYLISVLPLGFIFIEEIEPCLQSFSVESSVMY